MRLAACHMVNSFACLFLAVSSGVSTAAPAADVEQWGVWELALDGPAGGNPYLDVQLSATLRQNGKRIEVPGFYDGEGVYRIRFSPPEKGRKEIQPGLDR